MLKITVLLLVFCLTIVQAQESTVPAKEIEPREQKLNDDKDRQKTPEQLTPDIFIPTEKLSEDISANFPVDI